MMKKKVNQGLVIFGASGDLTYRKLIPAVFDLFMNNSLPEGYAVLGVSRTAFSDDKFRKKMKEGIRLFAHHKDATNDKINIFLAKIYYLSIDTAIGDEYGKVKEKLDKLNIIFNLGQNYIFYLSTPPALYNIIPKFLYGHGLTLQQKGFRRIIIEKPFGHDLQSA